MFQFYVVPLPSQLQSLHNLLDMKRKNGLLGILATLCLCMVFTSCHKDEKIAMKLSGEWEGYWGMYYEDRELGQFDSYKSSVVFYPDEKYDTKGKGYQIDWYSQTPNALGNKSPYEKMFYEFTWYVDKKIIYLTYPGHPELNSRIRNYELSKKHFTGYFNNSPTRFDLDAIWKVYKWSDYAALNMETANTILCWTWAGLVIASELSADNYYYYEAKTRVADGSADNAAPVEQHAIRVGNRFAE